MTFDASATNDVILVCVADDDLRHSVTQSLRDEWPVRTAHDEAEADNSLDEAVAVVVLDLTDDAFDVDRTLERRKEGGLSFETAALVDISPNRLMGKRFEGYVRKPPSMDVLQATVDRLQRRARYDRLLQRYYTLSNEYASVIDDGHPDELAQLQDRLVGLRDRLDAVADDLNDVDAFDVALED